MAQWSVHLWFVALLALCGGHQCVAGQAQVAHIAVAANFAEPIKAIAAVLQKTTGHTIAVTLGSTGKLYAQIQNGAPFDVLLAADTQIPQRLEKEGLTQAGSRFTYATGKLVLWSANAARVDAAGSVLKQANLGKVAYANPKVAPYGAAAVQVMDKLGLGGTQAGAGRKHWPNLHFCRHRQCGCGLCSTLASAGGRQAQKWLHVGRAAKLV
jgi:ABC-type molybdate transport system substrate-binding protein